MNTVELEAAIRETERQEKLFRLADSPLDTAYWVLERVKLRSLLFFALQKEAGL